VVERVDYPLYGIDRERGLFYICYIQERGYGMDLRKKLMDTVDKLDWNSCPPSEVNFLKHNINELLDDNKKLSEQLEILDEEVLKYIDPTVKCRDGQIDKILNSGVKIISAKEAKETSDNRSERKQIDQFRLIMVEVKVRSKNGHSYFHYRGSPLYPEVITSLEKLGYTITYPPEGERFIANGSGSKDMSPIRNIIDWV
jgi:hypothetical protein